MKELRTQSKIFRDYSLTGYDNKFLFIIFICVVIVIAAIAPTFKAEI